MGKAMNSRRKAQHLTIAEATRNKRMLLEVRQEAKEFAQGLARHVDPAEGVQQVLDNIATLYEYATQQVMLLSEEDYWKDTIAGKTLHHWIREQERLGLQMVHVAGKAASMGLAERQVRMQEGQAALFAAVVEAALISAGMDQESRRKVHEGIAVRLDDITGTAKELEVA